jgi:hypothetical protein
VIRHPCADDDRGAVREGPPAVKDRLQAPLGDRRRRPRGGAGRDCRAATPPAVEVGQPDTGGGPADPLAKVRNDRDVEITAPRMREPVDELVQAAVERQPAAGEKLHLRFSCWPKRLQIADQARAGC